MLNIRGLNKKNDDDIYFRYKMHKPVLLEQKNNKIFDNLDIICKDINRDNKILIKYFKTKMGISIIYKNNKIIIPKNVTLDQIMETLYEYIEKYVLCPACKLPETVLDGSNIQCKCCSFSGLLK